MKRPGKLRTARGVASPLALALLMTLLSQSLAGPAAAMDQPAARAHMQASGIAIVPESLVQYAALGDTATVNMLLDAGVDVNDADSVRQVSALHNAAAQGHLRLAARLLELGARVDAQDWYGVTPLVAAAAGGHLKLLELLLAKGSAVNVVPHKAPTALICAIEHGELALVEALLKAGARPDLADAFGRTPLAAAALAGQGVIATRIETALAGPALAMTGNK